MASFRATIILACVVCAVLMIRSTAGQDMSALKSACNGRGINLVSDYAQARAIALDQAVEHTQDIGFNYHGRSRYMNSIAYSHGQCDGKLIFTECGRCMQLAKRYIIMYCAENTEGWVQLKDCVVSFWEFPV